MCYYAVSIFLDCGHAVRAAKPIDGLSGCPFRRKEWSDRQYARTPSLTHSISTQTSPRTTVSSVDSLAGPRVEAHPVASETHCRAKLSHPLHTHRFQRCCPDCRRRSRARLADLDTAIAEAHESFVDRARRDRVRVTIEGRNHRRLRLVDDRGAEKAKAEQNANVGREPPSSPPLLNDSSSTLEYIKDLWARRRAAQWEQSQRNSTTGSPVQVTNPGRADKTVKMLEPESLDIPTEDGAQTRIAQPFEHDGGGG